MRSDLRSYERPANADWIRAAYAQVQVSNARLSLRQVLTKEQTEEIRSRAHARFDAWLAQMSQVNGPAGEA